MSRSRSLTASDGSIGARCSRSNRRRRAAVSVGVARRGVPEADDYRRAQLRAAAQSHAPRRPNAGARARLARRTLAARRPLDAACADRLELLLPSSLTALVRSQDAVVSDRTSDRTTDRASAVALPGPGPAAAAERAHEPQELLDSLRRLEHADGYRLDGPGRREVAHAFEDDPAGVGALIRRYAERRSAGRVKSEVGRLCGRSAAAITGMRPSSASASRRACPVASAAASTQPTVRP